MEVSRWPNNSSSTPEASMSRASSRAEANTGAACKAAAAANNVNRSLVIVAVLCEVLSMDRDRSAWRIIITMQLNIIDRARAIGFRLLLALAMLPAAHADWITREEDIMGTRCVV